MLKKLESLLEKWELWIKKYPKTVIALTMLIILLLPLILTNTIISIKSFTASGQIGDTIGGITSPFIGLLSAILIYTSFREQFKANNLLIESRDEDAYQSIASDLIKRLEVLIGDFKFRDKSGNVALNRFFSNVIEHMVQVPDRMISEETLNRIVFEIGHSNAAADALYILKIMVYLSSKIDSKKAGPMKEYFNDMLRMIYEKNFGKNGQALVVAYLQNKERVGAGAVQEIVENVSLMQHRFKSQTIS